MYPVFLPMGGGGISLRGLLGCFVAACVCLWLMITLMSWADPMPGWPADVTLVQIISWQADYVRRLLHRIY